jgi:hypothetical protein
MYKIFFRLVNYLLLFACYLFVNQVQEALSTSNVYSASFYFANYARNGEYPGIIDSADITSTSIDFEEANSLPTDDQLLSNINKNVSDYTIFWLFLSVFFVIIGAVLLITNRIKTDNSRANTINTNTNKTDNYIKNFLDKVKNEISRIGKFSLALLKSISEWLYITFFAAIFLVILNCILTYLWYVIMPFSKNKIVNLFKISKNKIVNLFKRIKGEPISPADIVENKFSVLTNTYLIRNIYNNCLSLCSCGPSWINIPALRIPMQNIYASKIKECVLYAASSIARQEKADVHALLYEARDICIKSLKENIIKKCFAENKIELLISKLFVHMMIYHYKYDRLSSKEIYNFAKAFPKLVATKFVERYVIIPRYSFVQILKIFAKMQLAIIPTFMLSYIFSMFNILVAIFFSFPIFFKTEDSEKWKKLKELLNSLKKTINITLEYFPLIGVIPIIPKY